MHANGHASRFALIPNWFPSHRGWLLAAMLASIGGCRPDAATVTNPDVTPAYGKAPGGASTVEVLSVAPSVAPTDTVVDVVIGGAGFERGAEAKWSINGDTTKVHVLSTTFVNAGQLKVRLQVPSTAPVGKYNVEVYLRDGKKGVGVERFTVVPGDERMDWYFPTDDASLGLRGDGLYNDGAGSFAYRHGECGLNGTLFLGNGGGDALMSTTNSRGVEKKCAAYPRKFRLVYNGISETRAGLINVRELDNPLSSIPIGTSATRPMVMQSMGTGSGCSTLRWILNLNGVTPVAADRVMVTRLDKYTWRVETQPAPANRAYCDDNGQSYNINVRFTIVVRNLPY